MGLDLGGLCHGLETLVNNPGLRDKISENAIAFFNEYGDVDKIYTKYATHIENLGEGKMRHDQNSQLFRDYRVARP